MSYEHDALFNTCSTLEISLTAALSKLKEELVLSQKVGQSDTEPHYKRGGGLS